MNSFKVLPEPDLSMDVNEALPNYTAMDAGDFR